MLDKNILAGVKFYQFVLEEILAWAYFSYFISN